MIAVFDLDGTVLDSSHRALINEQGGINIEEWRTHTREQILKDSELPLAQFMRECISNPSVRVWICTSRNLSGADYELLERLGLRGADLILSRDKNDNREDVSYKLAKIRKRLNLPSIRRREKIFFDDRADIRQAMKGLGFTTPAPHMWFLYHSA
tara:strand:- start:319 stop:783 length:465 start_codon:yes stop_codon:yes gene_type:complete